MSLYESFAQATALGDLHTCLMMDMKACQEDDVRLLCYLTPSIYSEVTHLILQHHVPATEAFTALFDFFCVCAVQFPDETLRSAELLNMIVAVIDSAQVSNIHL